MESCISTPRSISDPAEIDLTRHALIEASAGTGKTYTIENLVVRLIVERADIKIENILLVTFTEKAAGELKVRIREKIEQQFHTLKKDNAGDAEKLKKALEDFDLAPVFTIHGFCQNLLSELAFENNALFENELKDDQAIYDRLLKDQIRRIWPTRYGAQLAELLHLARFADEKDRLLEKIIRIARNISPAAGDRLLPQPDHDTYAQFRVGLESRIAHLKELLAGPPLFSEAYGKLNINARTRSGLVANIIRPLEQFFLEDSAPDLNIGRLSSLFKEISQVKSGQNKGIDALRPYKWLKAGPNPNVCPNLDPLIAAALELNRQIVIGSHWIVRESIFALKASVALEKQQHGWISFDDMLVRVYTALFSETAALLLERIREKYLIAFVDEFQDTDPIQWRIFRRIFIDDSDDSSCNPLIIIGDPKQAIYSFRGADVYAYLEARAAMAELVGKGRANLYSLCHNWRSLPEMVAGFNQIFSQPTWFCAEEKAAEFEIGYSHALSPGKEKLSLGIVQDDTGRAGLNLIDLREHPSSRTAQKGLGKFIASEINRLVVGKTLWLTQKDGRSRSLDYGDVAILVRSKSEARLLENYLHDAGIPFSFYKKPGLFQSEQAEELSLVFHAIIDPGNGDKVKKALLTPFFAADPLFLYTYNDLPVTHPVRQLLLRWNELALKRQWRPLFQSMAEESGLIFRLSLQLDWDRIHTNFSQIFEHLESEAYRRNLDFRALLALLDSYRSQTITAEEGADIHQIETEVRKVQIMTMHVSKGLQFPVVFIAGGLTGPFQADYHIFHQADRHDPGGEIARIIDLTKQNPDVHQKEQTDEDRRLFYVALTRAQIKLYLPYYPSSAAYGWIGPLSKFIAEAIRSAFEGEGGSADVAWVGTEAALLDASPCEFCGEPENGPSKMQRIDRMPLPPMDDFRSRNVHLNSYSSLNTLLTYLPQSSMQQDFQPDLQPAKDADEDWGEIPPALKGVWTEPRNAADSAAELPGGPRVGSMLHDILEQIDYGSVCRSPAEILQLPRTQGVIARNMALYRVGSQWSEAVAALIAAALTTPIPINGSELILGDLPKNKRLHEVEFYFPYIWGGTPPENDPTCRFHLDCDGYIRGFIDLIFQFENRYYIADWKSNHLVDGYGPEALKASMDHSGYHLQYQIYSLALLRWLEKGFGSVSKALDYFGGVFYFYLRGMGTGDQNGIYHVTPHALESRKKLEQELKGVLRRAVG